MFLFLGEKEKKKILMSILRNIENAKQLIFNFYCHKLQNISLCFYKIILKEHFNY